MLALPNVEVHAQIYSSDNSLVYRGTSQPDNSPVILKLLKQDYPTASQLTRYKQAPCPFEEFQLGTQDISDKFQIPQKLYGQKTEVSTLLAAFERVSREAGERKLRNCKSF